MYQRTKPQKEPPKNDKPGKDLLEHCRQLASYDDEHIRGLSEMFDSLKDEKGRDNFIGSLCSGMLDEILRLRRELRRPVDLKKKARKR